ncbi:MAG: hypothetical protein WCH52_11340 [Bacteroidota bacterium]
MNNLFLILNIVGIALYLSLLPVHFALYAEDSENGKTGFLKRRRFSSGILLIYLVFLSKSFGWNGFFGFGTSGIVVQLIWLFWNFRSELMNVTARYGAITSMKLAAYNAIGIATLIYQIILFFIRQ